VYAIQKALQKYQMTNNIWFRYLPPYIPGSTFNQMESLIEYRNYFNMDLDRLREEDKDPVFFSDGEDDVDLVSDSESEYNPYSEDEDEDEDEYEYYPYDQYY
jgi:hypothetical protein